VVQVGVRKQKAQRKAPPASCVHHNSLCSSASGRACVSVKPARRWTSTSNLGPPPPPVAVTDTAARRLHQLDKEPDAFDNVSIMVVAQAPSRHSRGVTNATGAAPPPPGVTWRQTDCAMIIEPNDSTPTGKTLIHVFPTTARTQQRVLSLLRRLAAAAFSPQRGFLGATLAHSVDGQRIVMQSEWSELAEFRRALRTPVGIAYWQRVRALLTHDDKRPGDVHVYDDLVSFYSLGAVTARAVPRPDQPAHSANAY